MTDRKKSRKKRGYMRHSGLRRRGSGNRGGVGRAGMGKRRSHKQSVFKPKNVKGFTLRKSISKLSIVNVSELEYLSDGKNSLNLEKTKVLGKGKISKKLEVSATEFSKTAKEKIEAVGGKVIGRH